jgi:hypothetical protein
MDTRPMPRTAIARPPLDSSTEAEKLAWAVNFAVLAPSKHNTQPWWFDVGHDAVDIHADGSRALVASDHFGRELLISCGAAIANLRLGIRALGYEAEVRVFPQGAHFSHLARVRLGLPSPITPSEQRLVAAVPRRQTQRLPLDGRHLPESLIVELEEAAQREGARLTFVETRRAQRAVADLIDRADQAQRGDAARGVELESWVRPPGSDAVDGIPADNVGVGAHSREMRFATRDFDVHGTAATTPDPAEDAPLLALLWTIGDEHADWVAAGRALQMVLLRACTYDVHASFVNQPLEAPDTRQLLADGVGISGAPQMLIRLGWGVGALGTPRRAVDDVINLVDPVIGTGAP